jgi:hypothetical protein
MIYFDTSYSQGFRQCLALRALDRVSIEFHFGISPLLMGLPDALARHRVQQYNLTTPELPNCPLVCQRSSAMSIT